MECPLCIREEGWIGHNSANWRFQNLFFFRNPWLRPLLLFIKPIDLHSSPFCIDRFHFRSGIWGYALKWREGHLCVWEIKSQASSSLPRLSLFVGDSRRLCSRLTQKHFKICEPFLLTIFRTVYSSIQKSNIVLKNKLNALFSYTCTEISPAALSLLFCFFALIRSGVEVTFFFSSLLSCLIAKRGGKERLPFFFPILKSEEEEEKWEVGSLFWSQSEN